MQLVRNTEDGGLQLIDMQIKDISLKTTLVKRSKGPCAKFANCFLPWNTEYIWQCNTSVKDKKKVCEHSFWRDVWIAWAAHNKQIVSSKADVLK